MELIQLYRSILRLHKSLPSGGIRYLGDEYARNEFKAHIKSATKEQLEQFYKAWKDYHRLLSTQLAEGRIGEDAAFDENFTTEQRLDLQKLKETIDSK